MKKILLILFSAIFLFSMISCKTTQKKPDETPQKAAVEKAVEKAVELVFSGLNAAAADAEAARKRAMDFDTNSYFPGDWEPIEAKYAEAGAIPRDSKENIDKATDLFKEVKVSYDELFEKAVPLYAQAREDEIMSVRTELTATAFAIDFFEYLDKADTTALEAWDQYENKDYYAAKSTAAKALEKYQALLSGALAYSVREEILKRNFSGYDQENFDKAEEAGNAALAAFDEGNIKLSRDNADEAQLRYNLVLNTAWAIFAAEKGKAAESLKQQAIDAKGNVAARTEFATADIIYAKAAALLKAEKFADAGDLFEKAELQFAEVIRITGEKRIAAEAAIREAEERTEESDEAARRAEEIIEGGTE